MISNVSSYIMPTYGERSLEFKSGKDRIKLLNEILKKEKRLIKNLKLKEL